MTRSHLTYAAIICLLSTVVATTAGAGLHPRLDGAAAYDDVLDITWLTDAGFSPNDSWENQLAWVESLNQAAYLGFNDWRLASMSVSAGVPTGTTTSVFDCSTVWEPLCRDNELSYMFYHNLGAQTGSDLTGDQTVGQVTLTNIQPVYWSATEYADPSAWIIHFTTGFGVWSFKSGNRHAWVVRSGDVATDTDADGIIDAADNCSLVSNPDQIDSNGDGFGNLCDPDLDNDGVVNFADLQIMASAFFGSDPDADLNSDQIVNFTDLSILKAFFLGTPGPSGIAAQP